MQLSHFISTHSTVTHLQGSLPTQDIVHVTSDSRQVKQGSIFVAIKGFYVDGHQFIAKAVKAGAVAIVIEEAEAATDIPQHIAVLLSSEPRRTLSELAASCWHAQPEHIVAVTGTNGKTSIAYFCQQLWESIGKQSASLGTLGLITSEADDITGALPALTTLDPSLLHEVLKRLADRNIQHLALEASSHGLDQYRLHGVQLEAAAFSNLSRDHLDYHKTMEHYLDAKMRLFEEILPPGSIAVLNADIPEYANIKARCEARGHTIISYGYKGDTIALQSVMPTHQGLLIAFTMYKVDYRVQLPLVGEFQVSNVLAALGMVMHSLTPLEREKVIAQLMMLQSVPGRMESVDGHPHGGRIFIDYAHTPDGLEKALQSLQPHVQGKLYVCFGCGGDRDQGKRKQMGRIASEYADYVYIADDNPRSEDPAAIRQDIMEGCDAEKTQNIGDRAKAITLLLQQLQEGDIALIAGKGHESTQIIGDQIIPFNDKEQAIKACAIIASK